MTDSSRDGVALQPPARPAPGAARAKPIEMRTVHRVLSLIAMLFLLYVGTTGTLIQALDLSALLRGAPETDITMQSINEGKFGNRPYSVVTVADWDGGALPQGYDTAKAFATTLAAFRAAVPGVDPQFVELRVANGKVIGQVGHLDPSRSPPPPQIPRKQSPDAIHLEAFDAATSARVEPVLLKNAVPPTSARQTLKQWHRFWGPDFFGTRDKPGVYVEFVLGLAFCTLLVTGLVMYFRLLKQRRKMGRNQLFWMAGETWRSLHRVVSVGASVILVLVALSGTWLGFESTYKTFEPRPKPAAIGTLSDEQAVRLAGATAAAFRAAEPDTPLRVLRVRSYAGMEQGVVVTGTGFTRQLVYNAATGEKTKLSEPGYPSSGFPLGMDVHEWVKHFHSGYLFGLPARFLDLLAGLSLIFLCVSGIVMYLEMYGKRRRAGRRGLFWR